MTSDISDSECGCCSEILCEHFTLICPLCTLMQYNTTEAFKKGICYGQCFYCIITGKRILAKGSMDFVPHSHNMIQTHNIYLIGYNDGHTGKDLPRMDCNIKYFETLYKDGYNAGKRLKDAEQELENAVRSSVLYYRISWRKIKDILSFKTSEGFPEEFAKN